MIDEIFEMIMKEARRRPGRDLTLNINKVFVELSTKLIETQDNLRKAQRRGKRHEG